MNSQKNAIILVVAIVAIVIAYFFIDFSSLHQSLKGDAQFITQDKECDLHKKSCYVKIQDGTSFELSIEPKSIELMKPLQFLVKSNNSNLKGLYLNIYATNMFMGEFKLPLQNMGKGAYKATATLPTCTVGNMKWNADIRVKKLSKTIGARFQFETDI